MDSKRHTIYDLSFINQNNVREKLKSQFSINKFINVKDPIDENLLEASINANTKMVKWCLKQGANIDCHYEDMLTPLHIAAEKGHEEMLDILLKHSNKYIDSKTLFGDTALLIATQNEHKLVNTMDTFGEHALCTAVITSPNPPVTYALLKNGANINCINSQGMSLLSEAILSAHTKSSIDAIKMLLRRGASVNMRNTINGQTPLHVAAQIGNQPIVELLVASGADTKVKDHHGRTPRDTAKQYGHPELVEKMRAVRFLNPVRLSSTHSHKERNN
ncbi:cyclin-dependent kinase 4 inhibitor C-like isoform X2 [Schistocerca gregaria]|uniref:cyclin-dependent kinase 4 inhibitor C-like isoform X2 n=1 Tax=Schistocerca gregaria TaxID=7010 RepID=UPI00211DF522|nr:cyclin-dependent kinase 4 inhibitor C-like isoform X2 [Schistocerca gregaria]